MKLDSAALSRGAPDRSWRWLMTPLLLALLAAVAVAMAVKPQVPGEAGDVAAPPPSEAAARAVEADEADGAEAPGDSPAAPEEGPAESAPPADGTGTGEAVRAEAAPEPAVVTEGSIGLGESLARSLGRRGVSARTVLLIDSEMSPVFNFRYAQPGDQYRLEQDAEGTVLRFRYRRSRIESYDLRLGPDGYQARRYEPELVHRRSRVASPITTSLYEAIVSLGERPSLASEFADIFAWDMDFSRAARSGDEFSILYDRIYLEDDLSEANYVRPGPILAALYRTPADEYGAIYYEIAPGKGGYYRLDGSAVERQFLKAPLRYSRISSSYSRSRLHPILKVRRPHLGIDYAASSGTPVWSVADGTVVHRGWAGGFGNLVKIRHANGFVSYYGHLSRYGYGLMVGDFVQQKQVIGYVGSTGLATGPHLDFRLKKDGKYVNPSMLRTPPGPPIPPELRDDFLATRDALMAELAPSPLVVVNEAL